MHLLLELIIIHLFCVYYLSVLKISQLCIPPFSSNHSWSSVQTNGSDLSIATTESLYSVRLFHLLVHSSQITNTNN